MKDITRITEYSTDTISQKHHFEVRPSEWKVVNVYFLSEGSEHDRDTLVTALNMRFPILMFEEISKIDFYSTKERPAVIVKRSSDNDNLNRFPAEFLKRCCILELFISMAPTTTPRPRSKTRTVVINGTTVSVFVFYMVRSGKMLPRYTNDSNEISFSDLSAWLSDQIRLNVFISLPDRLLEGAGGDQSSDESNEYTDPEVYEREYRPVSAAQEIDWNDFPSQSPLSQSSQPSSSSSSLSMRERDEERDRPSVSPTKSFPQRSTRSQTVASTSHGRKRLQPTKSAAVVDFSSDSSSSGSEFFSGDDDTDSEDERRLKQLRVDALL